MWHHIIVLQQCIPTVVTWIPFMCNSDPWSCGLSASCKIRDRKTWMGHIRLFLVHTNSTECEISISHGGEYEAQNLLVCTAVFLILCRLMFQRCVLPPIIRAMSEWHSALMMEAAVTSETSVDPQKSVKCGFILPVTLTTKSDFSWPTLEVSEKTCG
jgi:hypothetical protein